MTDRKIVKLDFLNDRNQILKLFGTKDENLIHIEKKFAVNIYAMGTNLEIAGEKKNRDNAAKLILYIGKMLMSKIKLNSKDIKYMTDNFETVKNVDMDKALNSFIKTNSKKGLIQVKTEGQRKYVESIRDNILTFSIGPAGTGKTYLAIACSIEFLLLKKVNRIIVTRPAVEAGEKLGFLPGDIEAKVSPYLRPVYAALYDMMRFEKVNRMIQAGVIEIAPLAFMRGRTLNDAFIVLDEAQNCTLGQLKMFLTRTGFNSKVVVTGDITQIDLADKEKSGLVLIQNILQNINGISFVYLEKTDVIRHKIVQYIVGAFEKSEN